MASTQHVVPRLLQLARSRWCTQITTPALLAQAPWQLAAAAAQHQAFSSSCSIQQAQQPWIGTRQARHLQRPFFQPSSTASGSSDSGNSTLHAHVLLLPASTGAQQQAFASNSKGKKKGKNAKQKPWQPPYQKPPYQQPPPPPPQQQQPPQQQPRQEQKQQPNSQPRSSEQPRPTQPERSSVLKTGTAASNAQPKVGRRCTAVPTPAEAEQLRTRMQVAAWSVLLHDVPHTMLLSMRAQGLLQRVELFIARLSHRAGVGFAMAMRRVLAKMVQEEREQKEQESSGSSADDLGGGEKGSFKVHGPLQEFMEGAKQAVRRVLELHGSGGATELAALVSPRQRDRMVAEHEQLAAQSLHPISCDNIDVQVVRFSPSDDTWLPAAVMELMQPGAEAEAAALAAAHEQELQQQQQQQQQAGDGSSSTSSSKDEKQQREEQEAERRRRVLWEPMWQVRCVRVLASHATTFANVEVDRQSPGAGLQEAELRPPSARPLRGNAAGLWLFVRGPCMVGRIAVGGLDVDPHKHEYAAAFVGMAERWMWARPVEDAMPDLDWRLLVTVEDVRMLLDAQVAQGTIDALTEGHI